MNKVIKPAAMRESRDIERIVNWALEKQGLGHDMTGHFSGPGGSGSALGTRIDGGGIGNDGKWTHADAEIVAAQINQMARDHRTSEAAALVVRYGMLGTRPHWGEATSGHYQLMRKGNGKAIRRFLDQRKQDQLIGFHWEWVGPSVEDAERDMLEYAAWHAALCDLRDHINPLMTTYFATGPIAPESPWDEAERTIIHPTGASPIDA